jgi:hypothetical protein
MGQLDNGHAVTLKKCQIGLEKISGIAFSAIKKDSQNLLRHFNHFGERLYSVQ